MIVLFVEHFLCQELRPDPHFMFNTYKPGYDWCVNKPDVKVKIDNEEESIL